jgi:hypothetical protein
MGKNALGSRDIVKTPWPLFVLDIILAIVITRNMWAFFMAIGVSNYVLQYDFDYIVRIMYMLASSVYMSVSVIFTMMTLQSGKKEAWRAAARRSFMIAVTGYMNEYLKIGFQTMMFEEALALFAIAYVILFLPSVRRFYTPPLAEEKSILAWAKYIIIKPKDWNRVYSYRYNQS